jgi:hypothetical protein
MIRTISAEVLAFLAALLFTVFAAGIVVGAGANVFWPVFLVIGSVVCYVLRPWMRQVLNVPTKTRP